VVWWISMDGLKAVDHIKSSERGGWGGRPRGDERIGLVSLPLGGNHHGRGQLDAIKSYLHRYVDNFCGWVVIVATSGGGRSENLDRWVPGPDRALHVSGRKYREGGYVQFPAKNGPQTLDLTGSNPALTATERQLIRCYRKSRLLDAV